MFAKTAVARTNIDAMALTKFVYSATLSAANVAQCRGTRSHVGVPSSDYTEPIKWCALSRRTTKTTGTGLLFGRGTTVLYRIPLATLEYQSLSETMAGGKNAASVTEGMLVTYVL